MECNDYMDRFLELDREKPSGDLAEHLAACPRCSEEARRLNAAYSLMAKEGRKKPVQDLVPGIMAALQAPENSVPGIISPFQEEDDDERPLRNWIWSGVFLLLGMMLIPFSTILPGLIGLYGKSFDITMHLILGLFITVYGTVFIISHMGMLRRVLRLENYGLRK